MLRENILLALSSLKANKMRALLTMLGIIIGIMSIITIIIIGDAMTASISGELSSLGASNVTISVRERGDESMDMAMWGGRNSTTSGKSPTTHDLISNNMLSDMKANFPDEIIGVSLSHSRGNARVNEGENYANIQMGGVNEDYGTVNNIKMLSGSFISDADVEHKNQSAVVSDKFVNNLFPDGREPIGQTVKVYRAVNIEIYTIIGVYQYESMGMDMMMSDRDISTGFFIPVSTAKQDVIEKNYTTATVMIADDYDVNEMTDKLQNYFDGLYAGNRDWRVSASNMTSMLDTIESTLKIISTAIAIIAGISLLVGGIGVMNIMLVSVTERTREIGTRKALGAKKSNIQLQFVTEALIITLIGGIIGLLLGIGVGALATMAFGVPLTLSAAAIIGSVLFSMAIGIFFGLYPANKAAKLDPIEALRYE